MNAADEQTRSIWMDTRVAGSAALEHSEQADVAIVGSGIAGLSVAYELAKRGRSVIVLDRGKIGGGMSARTTAHLASALDDLYAAQPGCVDQDTARDDPRMGNVDAMTCRTFCSVHTR